MIAKFLVQIGIPQQYVGDLLVALFFVILGIAITAIVKKKNLGALMVSMYISYAVVTKIFYQFAQQPIAKMIIFLALVSLLFSLIQNHMRIKISGSRVAAGAKTALVSLTITGLLASIVLQWLPESFLTEEFFTAASIKIFFSKEGQLAWMVAPLIAVFALKHRQ